ncbi:MAG: hypothetical protein KKB51_14925 [Candidatus Riflebacteria bacterium]|nr:hypothetical protein [Candidatus Riflebacteria bacterium]
MPLVCQYSSKFSAFLFPLAFVVFLTAVIAGVWLVIGGGANSALMLVTALALLGLIVWVMLNLTTSYEFYADARQVVFCTKLGRWQRRVLVSRFDDAAAFTVKGIHNRARVQTWWEYQVVMLIKTGRLVEVSGRSAKSVHESNRLAEKLAAAVGCEYFPGQNEKTIQVAIAGEHPIFEYRDWNWGDVVREFGLPTLASLLFFFAIVAFIVALVVMLS